jgi:hypothetical protein
VVHSGQPEVTFPGFDVLPDGRSVVTVQVSGNTDVTEQKSEGRLVYFLRGVSVPEKVNRLPLVSTNFASQVARVEVQPADGGANVIIELREAAAPTHTLAKIDGGTLLTVVLPKSDKFGDNGQPTGANAKSSSNAADSDDDVGQGDGRHHRRKGRKSEAELDKEDKADDADFKRGSAADDEEAEHARRWKRKVRQPVPYVERHITLSYRTLAPDVGVSFNGFGKGNPAAYLMSGFHLGIVDQFEIEVTPNGWRLAPHGGYYLPSFGATWNFVQTKTFDMAVRARFFIPVDTGATTASGLVKPKPILAGGVPLIFHLGTIGKIDTGAMVTIPIGGATVSGTLAPVVGASPTTMGLYDLTASPYYIDPGIPIKLVFQPADAAFVGVTTGLSIFDFKNVSKTVAIPLGFQVGVTTTSNKKPAADFGVKFDWKRFIQPGVEGDRVEPKDYELAAWLRWFYYM